MHKIVGIECGFPLRTGNRRIDEREKTQHYTLTDTEVVPLVKTVPGWDTPDNAGLYALVKNDQDQWEREETPLVARFRRFLADAQAS
jgi:hypothetical protein